MIRNNNYSIAIQNLDTIITSCEKISKDYDSASQSLQNAIDILDEASDIIKNTGALDNEYC